MVQQVRSVLGELTKRAELICSLPFHQQLTLFSVAIAKEQLGTGALAPDKVHYRPMRVFPSCVHRSLVFGQVFSAYRTLCKQHGFGSVSISEFKDMCSALEGHSLISTSKGKGSLRVLLQARPHA